MNKLQHHVVRTPVDTLNLLGCGGLKAGTMVMAYGVSGSGKTTFFSQTAALYQRDNPDAVVFYIDVENSVDINRLEHVFKFDMDRLEVVNTATLEGAFKLILDIAEQMTKQQIGKYKDGRKDVKILSKEKVYNLSDSELFKYCENFRIPSPKHKGNEYIKASNYNNDRDKVLKALALAGGYTMEEFGGPIPTIVIWDSIATSRPELELEKIAEGDLSKNAGGMNLSTQIISKNLSAVLGSQGGKPLTVLIPNQVRLKDFGSFMGPKEGFAGSYAIEHNMHYIIKFTKINNKDSRIKNYDDDNQIKTGTDFFMTIEKTKFCPATGRVDLYINDARGGIIVPKEELAHTALNLGIINKVHGGYEIPDSDFPKMKWTKEEDEVNYISGNSDLRKELLQRVTKHYRTAYFTLDIAYRNAGLDDFGKPDQEEVNNKMNSLDGELLDECYNDNPFS